MDILTNMSIIVSCDVNGGISTKDNIIPWQISDDLKFFKSVTSEIKQNGQFNALIVGRVTAETLPKNLFKNDRRLYVITHRKNFYLDADYKICDSLDAAILLAQNDGANNIFCIGGAKIYEMAMRNAMFTTIYLTYINHDYYCDGARINLDYIFENFSKHSTKVIIKESKYFGIDYSITKITRNVGENKYLDLIRTVLKKGDLRMTRPGINAVSCFGRYIKINLRSRCDLNLLPMLTTKFVSLRIILAELFWFLSGESSIDKLRNNNVHIWDGNTSREYLDSVGLYEYVEGETGPIYGWQWRHYGAPYTPVAYRNANWVAPKGVDQITELIKSLRNDPTGRRHILCAWNPEQNDEMVLPPCHMMAQWYIKNNYLKCMMTMRSADIGLGLPYNMVSYSLLTHMIARVLKLKGGSLLINIGDAHIYENHIDALKMQVERQARDFPILTFSEKSANYENIDEFDYDDFILSEYYPEKKIKMQMAA